MIAAQAANQPVTRRTREERADRQLSNGGTDYRPKGDPRRAKVHDFEDKELGKGTPTACTTSAR